MTKREQSIVIGCVLGDGYLQKTGKQNARLRLEHSAKQKEYIFWKWQELKAYMQDKPKLIIRFNPIWQQQYNYYRCQSHASPEFGKLRVEFYENDHKQFPESILKHLRDPLSLAVWYMDDGYYYRRDRAAYIYLHHVAKIEKNRIQNSFSQNFALHPKLETKKTGNFNLKFPTAETTKLFKIIAPYMIPSMRYKLVKNPVSTEGFMPEVV